MEDKRVIRSYAPITHTSLKRGALPVGVRGALRICCAVGDMEGVG